MRFGSMTTCGTRATAALMCVVIAMACERKPRERPRPDGPDTLPDIVQRASPVADAGAGPSISRCMAGPIVALATLERDSMRIFESRLDGIVARTIHKYAGRGVAALDATWTHAFDQTGYVTIVSGATRAIRDASLMNDVQFLDDRTIVAAVQHDTTGTPWTSSVEVRDIGKDSVVASFMGYVPRVAPGGAVLYLRQQKPTPPRDTTEEEQPEPVEVMRWTNRETRKLTQITLSSEGGPYSVSDLVPLGRESFAYRQDDEHEHRYYDNVDGAYYPGSGHFIADSAGQEISKEQYDLTLSRDGRYAVYTERSWNSLTYIVVVDLAQKRRIQTPYHGSFPRVYGEHVIFVSDPAFVTAPDTASFRQITQYAVYAYHIPTGVTCLVNRYPSAVAVVSPIGSRR